MTTLLEKILVGVIAILIAVGTGEWFLLKHEEARTATLNKNLAATEATLESEKATNSGLQQSLNAVQAALDAKIAAMNALKAKDAKAQGELDAALKANAAWSSQRVPDAVFDSLFGPAPGTDQDGHPKDATAK